MKKEQILQKLYDFRDLDKYATFSKAMPGIIHTADDQQEIINTILNTCAKELIIELESVKRPTKTALKTIIAKSMNNITAAGINTENKDFGYHLCWFLAEKVGLDLWKQSTTKIWGYWEIIDNQVKTTKYKKPKN